MVMVRILVVEDNPMHLEAARQYASRLIDVTVDFATNLEDAGAMLARNPHYDGAICDVFFPKRPGEEPSGWENAVQLSAWLHMRGGVHHVFNTSGNHHGEKYHGFNWKTPKVIHKEDDDTYHFLTSGMVIEAYPENDPNGDKDTKQWEAAFRYILLVLELLKLEDKGASLIEKTGLRGFPFGDYGTLTETLRTAAEKEPYTREVFTKYGA